MDLDSLRQDGAVPAQLIKPEKNRPKSSQRMKYEAEVRFFRETYGGLDQVRLRLGLSRRKICQLLLVDPSAWTRWERDETRVPPHIFRALEWYISLAEKDPGRSLIGNLQKQWRIDLNFADVKIAQLSSDLRSQKSLTVVLAALVSVTVLALIYLMLTR